MFMLIPGNILDGLDSEECSNKCYTSEQMSYKPPKSEKWDKPVQLTFENKSGYTAQIVWYDYSGNPVGYEKLSPG